MQPFLHRQLRHLSCSSIPPPPPKSPAVHPPPLTSPSPMATPPAVHPPPPPCSSITPPTPQFNLLPLSSLPQSPIQETSPAVHLPLVTMHVQSISISLILNALELGLTEVSNPRGFNNGRIKRGETLAQLTKLW